MLAAQVRTIVSAAAPRTRKPKRQPFMSEEARAIADVKNAMAFFVGWVWLVVVRNIFSPVMSTTEILLVRHLHSYPVPT